VKLNDISIDETIKQAETFLSEDKSLSPGIKSTLSMLILIVKLLVNRLGLNSRNSSKPPSCDPNREKKSKKNELGKKPGGQNGHEGSQLKQVEKPDEIHTILVDKEKLPLGDYHEVGYVSRQVIDIRISRHVIEYRVQILANQNGKQFSASFPAGVTRPAQYGQALKATVVYQSQFQLLPYNRIDDYFTHEIGVSISQGSIYNFNKEAYLRLESFEQFVKEKLITAKVLNVDETGINVNGKGAWIHLAANEKYTYFFPHAKRGSIAMNAMGILPHFEGTLCHDHWKPYFIYECMHSLCNAHHVRELESAFEQDKQNWALTMKQLLLEMNTATQEAGGVLSENEANKYYKKYKAVIKAGEIECPLPESVLSMDGKKKRGRVKKSKARNLLERLRNFEKETLRFIAEVDVPFTNNLAENNIRMTKVQQKISGCFRSMVWKALKCSVVFAVIFQLVGNMASLLPLCLTCCSTMNFQILCSIQL
jgi:transposase